MSRNVRLTVFDLRVGRVGQIVGGRDVEHMPVRTVGAQTSKCEKSRQFHRSGRFRTPMNPLRVFRRAGHLPVMLSSANLSALSCYRRALGSRCRAAYRQGRGVWWRPMATVANGYPAHPGSTADLDSHLLAALRWSVQKGATLGDLSHEFSTNANRVLNAS